MADPLVSACQSQPRLGNHIADVAITHLQKHQQFRGRDLALDFELNDNVLIIRGRVPSFYLKQLLQTVLRDLEHVSRIENRVDVISSTNLSSALKTPPTST